MSCPQALSNAKSAARLHKHPEPSALRYVSRHGDRGSRPLPPPSLLAPRGSSIMHASRFTSITPHPSSLAFVAVPHSPTAGSTAAYSASLRHTACPALLLPAQRMDRLIRHRRRVTTQPSYSGASGCQLQLSALLPSTFASACHGASRLSPAHQIQRRQRLELHEHRGEVPRPFRA